MSSLIRVFSVDDHPLVREGLAAIVNSQPDMKVIAQASKGCDAITRFTEYEPDITLMDLRLPDMSGIDAMVAIRKTFPDARVIMVTISGRDAEIRRALALGARSYVLKSMPYEELVETIRHVHAGKMRISAEVVAIVAAHFSQDALTERQIDVLKLVMEGNRNRDIASRLFISEETVKAHLKHLMGKLGAADRTQAVTTALRRGLIEV